jgi:hypothetical protein
MAYHTSGFGHIICVRFLLCVSFLTDHFILGTTQMSVNRIFLEFGIDRIRNKDIIYR